MGKDIDMKTTTKHKEKPNGQKETQSQEAVPEVVQFDIIPAGGSVVVPDQSGSLRLIRMKHPSQIKIFEKEIIELFNRFIERSCEDVEISREALLDYIAYCDKPEVFFIVAIDENYRCKGYLLGQAMFSGTFFIRQLVTAPGAIKDMASKFKEIDAMAASVGCTVIEGNTRRSERAYERWAKALGMRRSYTVFRRTL